MLRFEFRLHSVSRGVSAAGVAPGLAIGIETGCIRCDKTRHELLQQIRRRHVSQTFSESSVTNNANSSRSGPVFGTTNGRTVSKGQICC
ncbi:hypothetical protein RESH_03687 [Rhodopirellula europaea SH398]|uniref:Uncharacterized protein n=1 Tax=Rhodopirellula europaea SH398 TaxID=1263868 RepID=M5S287_9BACT|nr:hypothetical protein RESH_03687 [Rhodopirellula europaea SH398]